MRIVLVYAVVAGVWIWASDSLSRAMTVNPNLLTFVAIAKGMLFVVVTSALLFVQIRRDLADLEASRDQLRDSEQRFRRVIELSPVPMTMSDADGNVTLANAAFVRTLGYTSEEMSAVSELWPTAYPDPEYHRWLIQAWQSAMERSRQTGETFTPLEARIRGKDGTDRTMLLTSAPPRRRVLGAGRRVLRHHRAQEGRRGARADQRAPGAGPEERHRADR